MELLAKLGKHRVVDSALFIAAITGTAYVLNYMYEASYLSYFGAGEDSARIELEPVLITSFVVFVAVGIVGYVLFRITQGLAKEKRDSWRYLARMFVLLAAVLLLCFMPVVYTADPAGFAQQLVDQLANVILLVLAASVCAGLVTFGKLVLRRQRTSVETIADKQKDITTKFLFYSLPIIIVLLLLGYANFFGIFSAYNNDRFKLVRYGGQDYVVLREYHTHFVMAEYSAKTNVIIPSYAYLNLDNTDFLKFTMLKKKPNYRGEVASASMQNVTIVKIHKKRPYIEFGMPKF